MRIGLASVDVEAPPGSVAGPLYPWHLARRLAVAARDSLAAEQDRWFLWAVAAFGAGIALYFLAGVEPPLILAAALGPAALAGLAFALRVRGLSLRFVVILVAAAALGFAAGKLRTEMVRAPVIAKETGPLPIEGRIEEVSLESANRARIVLRPSRLGTNQEELPQRLRLTVRGEKAVAAVVLGASVSLTAVVMPPPAPAQPGDYDFARWAFFERIGGVGYAMGAPVPADAESLTGWRAAAAERIERLRQGMVARIRAVVPGPEGGIAAALITGERGGIAEPDNNAYRDSGLAHVLSISGLHMALAGLTIFWTVRALLALFGGLALRYPIKKWAAIAALFSASFYLLISGGGAPPLRSYIMLGTMLVAILLDRPALSMRNVALAALIIMVLEPESVIEAGFQMSFAAVIALIAVAEWNAVRRRDQDGHAFAGPWRGAVRYVSGLSLTSIVAGLATAPFAIYHFDRAGGYGLLANLLAMPVVGAVVMPFAALGVVVMPFGGETWPLQAMAWGVRAMSAIAHWVAGLPGAVALLPAWPMQALVLIVSGGLWMALWRRRWRWLGGLAIVAGVAVGLSATPPDVLIARDAKSIAVRQDDRLVLTGALDDYTAEQWLRHDGDSRLVADAVALSPCDEWGCVLSSGGRTVALARHAGALAEDCARAAVLVSAVPIRRPCDGPLYVADLFSIMRDGATALWFEEDGVRVKTAAAARGRRPWGGTQ